MRNQVKKIIKWNKNWLKSNQQHLVKYGRELKGMNK